MIIHDACVVDVYGGRVLEKYSIAICGEWIASVLSDTRHILIDSDTIVVDACGLLLAPGFIDTHSHIDAITSLDCLASTVLLHGTTTVVTEVNSVANALGFDGLKWYMQASSKCSLAVLILLPAISFLYGKSADGGPCLTERQMNVLLRHPQVVGIGECFWKDLFTSGSLKRLVRRARSQGMAVDGHGTGIKGSDLGVWASLGVLGDHECVRIEDVLSRVRMGMYALLREGSKRSDLRRILGDWQDGIPIDRITVATDTMLPHDMIKKGYMDFIVRTIIESGINPVQAITMATRNAASYLGVEMVLGSLLPGRVANILFLSDLEHIQIEAVLSKGKFVVTDGIALLEEKEPAKKYPRMRHLSPLSEDQILPPPCPEGAKIRAIRMTAPTLTREVILDHTLGTWKKMGLCLMATVSRHSVSQRFVGFVEGFGLTKGAFANSISFDESAICSIGADTKSVLTALNRVFELGGGIVLADGERTVEELALPIAGVQSDKPFNVVAEFLKRVPCVLRDWGCKWDDPLYSARTLTFTGLPDFRITTHGYFDVLKGMPVPLFT
jgi:adenine deaminase